MATIYRVYNAERQQLNSDKQQRLNRFFSDNYNGVINFKCNGVEHTSDSYMDDVVKYENGYVRIEADFIWFLIRGLLFTMNHPSDDDTTRFWGGFKLPEIIDDKNYNLIGIIVDVDGIKNDEYNSITHNKIHPEDSIPYSNYSSNCSRFGVNRITGFKIEPRSDESGLYNITVKDGYNYGSAGWTSGYKFNAIKFTNLQTFSGATKTGYMIPVAAIDSNGNYIRLLECHSKSSLEEFLSRAAVSQLKSDLDEKYVHRSGSTSAHPYYGKIGSLNVTGNHVEGVSTNIIYLDTKYVYLPGAAQRRKDYDEENGITQKAWGESTQGLPLILYKNGYVWPSRWITIEHGGTGADNIISARKNLGITSGTTVPSDSTGENGDIFLKIIG